MTPARRLRVGALLVLGAGHLLVSLFAVVPGYLSIDEATYHLMTKSQSETGGFEIWNGYRELPSPELLSASTAAHGPKLVGQPPVHTAAAFDLWVHALRRHVADRRGLGQRLVRLALQ